MKSKLPVLNLKGSPRQIGYNHGKKARSEIEHNLEVYFRHFKSETELSRDVAVSRAAKFLEVIETNSPDVLSSTEAGVVGGKIGLYSEGVGLLINGSVSSKDDWARLKKPFHVRCWEILRSKTLGGAVKVVAEGQRNCSANFILGQQKKTGLGKVVDVESAPEAVCELGPDRGALAHTNHFSNPRILGVKQVLDEERLSTLQRYRRIQKLLDGTVRVGQKLNLVAAQNMLRDHQGKPESVCRHSNLKLAEYERYETVVSVIMDLHSRKLWATIGSPCSSEYQSMTL